MLCVDILNPQKAEHAMNSLMFLPGNGKSSIASFLLGTSFIKPIIITRTIVHK